MPRIRTLASALAFAICCTTAAQAQQFTSFAAFGDSLSDAGNFGSAVFEFPPGNSFTTNPDPVAAQIIAGHFGLSADQSTAGGTDFAWGAACVNNEGGPCQTDVIGAPQIPNLDLQISQYLAATGGKADPFGLYTFWGGANDIFGNLAAVSLGQGEGGGDAAVVNPQAITPISFNQALANMAHNGVIAANEIGRLQTAGATHIIVFNLPDIGKTPAFLVQGADAQQAATALTLDYNNSLNAALAGRTGIIRADMFGLFNEILANPAAFGFTDVTHPACGPAVPQLTSVACGPAGDPNFPFHYDPATVDGFAFADGVHPTGAGHAIIAQYVLAELAAPSYASMLAETPLQVFDAQNRAIHGQFQADMGKDRAAGTLRSFAVYDYTHQRYDLTATSPQTSVRDNTLVLGADYKATDSVSFGVASTLTHQDATFAGGGSFMNNEPMIAAWGLFHGPEFYVSILGSVGQLNFNGIDRVIQLGAMTRTETASTGGSHTGVELAGGYLFHWGDLRTGPFGSISHQRVRVSSYNENNSDSTTMFFDRQNRDSTIGRIGWELAGDSHMMGGSIHPFGRIAFEHESDADPRFVSAGLVGLNGSFAMEGFRPDDSFWSGEFGVAAEFGDHMSGFASYNGHFGDSNQRADSFNLGLKWSW